MNTTEQSTVWERNKILLKSLCIATLVLLMLIPQYFITNLIEERQTRQSDVVKEISSKWAGGQTISGPVLAVPYMQYALQHNGSQTATKHTAYFLPDELDIKGDMKPEVRHRSLFDVTLYKSNITMAGKFGNLPFDALQIAPENIDWKDAHIIIGLGDVHGLNSEPLMSWNGAAANRNAESIQDDTLMKQGLSIPVSINAAGPATFSINLALRGAEYMHFAPTGKSTTVSLHAPWKDPAFEGNYLPSEKPDISDKGFTANWKILPVAHSFPQYWKDVKEHIDTETFGVSLLQPVDSYAKTMRSVKYALLFITLTFTVFFFLEILQRKQVHPLQYILVGFALCIFYTLLLSISEYAGFNIAYIISSFATVMLIGMYVWSIFKNGKTGILFGTALSVLYVYIFILINSQDYALLFGSIGLFVVIAVMMYVSRKIDWYHLGNHGADINKFDETVINNAS